MKEDTKARVVAEVLARCQVNGAAEITATAEEHSEEIDQSVTDRFYSLRIEARFPGAKTSALIQVEVAEYAFSNPAVDNIEILSVQSDICR